MKTTITYTEDLRTVREAASSFQCATSTLKSWLKKGEIPSFQHTETSAHLINPEHVERRLRNSSHVKSIFHPTPENPSPFSFKEGCFPSIMKAANALPETEKRVLITSLGGHLDNDYEGAEDFNTPVIPCAMQFPSSPCYK